MSGYVVPVAAFDTVLDEVAETFTVVAVDHRGSGDSRWLPLPTTTGTMAVDALSVLNHLRIDAAHVVGSSLGGMVAQELAIIAPHRVRTLVLCSTTAGGSGAKAPPARNIVRELKLTASRVPGGRVRVGPIGALQQAAAAATHDATRRLRRVQAPTLVLHGAADELVPLVNASWLASQVEGAELRVVPDGTHLLVLDSAVARTALRGWLHEHRLRDPDGTRPSPAAYLAEAPCRLLTGQTVPLRRAIRLVRKAGHAGSRSAPRASG
jgi:pimeloyl-ACP methyl ester carboxylesterase